MSNAVQNLVWIRFPAEAGRLEKFVALCLAEHANDDGSSVFPSHARIAAWCSCSRREVCRVMAALRGMGFIIRLDDRCGGVRQYRIDLQWLKASATDLDGARAVTPNVIAFPTPRRQTGSLIAGMVAAKAL